jgi:cellulose synthase/poly-beta-1,6-N-acetylglucosamine synthase-like glycosyltransferase
MKDKTAERFLVEYFSHLMYQTFKDFDIVISDQSEDDNLKIICDTFSHVLDIKYFKNTSNKKNAANNVNNAVRYATGEIVKLLYMDDFFVDQGALLKISNAFDSNPAGKWFISGFTHSNETRTQFFDTRLPMYENKYVNGDNTTGNPSNYAVRRDCAIEMDDDLLWIVDGEYFYRSYYYHGDPIMIDDVLVCFREHGSSAFRDPKFQELDAKERQYCIDKYNGTMPTKEVALNWK